ncbi:MAG: hypothetical protein ABIP14_13010 [Blastocatellia bacterium]
MRRLWLRIQLPDESQQGIFLDYLESEWLFTTGIVAHPLRFINSTGTGATVMWTSLGVIRFGQPILANIKLLFSQLNFRSRVLLSVWLAFALLVLFGVQGSSNPHLSQLWAPDKPFSGYVFSRPLYVAQKYLGLEPEALAPYFLALPRSIRVDEYWIFLPYALSQLSHQPRFPVINTSIGTGQNMFVVSHLQVPIWHPATIARPMTWGFFLFGAERGVAWQWWFSIVSCFTTLLLLLEVILNGRTKLACFGAGWFCASAYIAATSLFPAYHVFFSSLGCLAAYHILKSKRRRIQILCAVLLGLSIPGFIMLLYPPFELPLTYACLALFCGLVIRDRLYHEVWKNRGVHYSLLLAFVIAVVVTGSFLYSSLPALKLMTQTVYPGSRWSLGGGIEFAQFFKGMYNWQTINTKVPDYLWNQSEAASFYYLFPGVFFALLLSRHWRKNLGPVGWALVSFLVFMLVYVIWGLPKPIGRVMLMTRATVQRADLGIGFASVLLSVFALERAATCKHLAFINRKEVLMPGLAALMTAMLIALHGVFLNRALGGYFVPNVILLVALAAGGLTYFMLSGKKKEFCLTLGGIVLITSGLFNPLSHGLSHLYTSEMAQQILRLNQTSGKKPRWIAYGEEHAGILILMLGGRVIDGVHWHPELDLWRKFDPSGEKADLYNRTAHIFPEYDLQTEKADFSVENGVVLKVKVSPLNPVFKELGLRYVLVTGKQQELAAQDSLKQVYKSQTGFFTIYELPD